MHPPHLADSPVGFVLCRRGSTPTDPHRDLPSWQDAMVGGFCMPTKLRKRAVSVF